MEDTAQRGVLSEQKPQSVPPMDLVDEEPKRFDTPVNEGKKYDPTKQREDVRAELARALIAVLAALTIACVLFVAADPEKQEPIVELLKFLFTPLVGLVGSAIGFYFGAGSTTK